MEQDATKIVHYLVYYNKDMKYKESSTKVHSYCIYLENDNINILKLSRRAENCLKNNGYNTVGEVIRIPIEQLYVELFVGTAWLIGGLVVTVGSYMAAVSNGDRSYVIAWGAILFGGIQVIRSFYNYSKINRAVN